MQVLLQIDVKCAHMMELKIDDPIQPFPGMQISHAVWHRNAEYAVQSVCYVPPIRSDPSFLIAFLGVDETQYDSQESAISTYEAWGWRKPGSGE